MGLEETMSHTEAHAADLWNLALSIFAVSTFSSVLVWIVSL